MDKKYSIELSKDEILVLYDWLYRISENAEYFAHDAEQKVLWLIESQLDKQLIEPFMANYREIIEAARNNIIK